MDFSYNEEQALELKEQAKQQFWKYAEYIAYGYDAKFWEDKGNPVAQGIRFAIGQYLKKGGYREMEFCDYVEALSPDIGHGILHSARNKGFLPKYKRSTAIKYDIGKNCGGTGTGCLYGYDLCQ